MRALIVDDSRAIRGIIKKMLGEIGFETIEAAHGTEAIERLRDAARWMSCWSTVYASETTISLNLAVGTETVSLHSFLV
jgi:CheY-like chemotaxis protein